MCGLSVAAAGCPDHARRSIVSLCVIFCIFCSRTRSGHGDEREREFEAAATRGFRLCAISSLYHCINSTTSDSSWDSGPTCKKAVDFGDKHVFKSSVFEPTPEAIRNADLADERVKDVKDHHAMTSSAHPTATAMDIMELTDSEDDELPEFEELLQQSSSQKSQKSSSQKTVKRLESMKLEDDGFEMTGSLSTSTGLSLHPLPRS